MKNEAGNDIRIQDSVCLLGEDWVRSIEVRLDPLCLWEDLNSEGTQRASTVIQLGRRKYFRVFCDYYAESVDS